jgi:4'-phosphopantetheinyl transferase
VLVTTPILKERWKAPPADLTLQANDVHLWRGLLDLPITRYWRALSSITAEDLARAAEFRFERDRLRFIASRATLRSILSRYVGCTARNIQFAHLGTKPTLTNDSRQKIHFNVSHAGHLMICAVAHSEVGVDIERCPSNIEREEILRLMFPSAALTEKDENARNCEFVKLWTRTEAEMKLIGCGLADERIRLSAMALRNTSPTCEHFEPEQDYWGTVAMQSGAMRLCFWSFVATE